MLRRWREEAPLWPLRLALVAVGVAVAAALEPWDDGTAWIFILGLLLAGFVITFAERRFF